MLTRSELCGHRNATLNSRMPLSSFRFDQTVGFPLSARDVFEQLDSSCPLDV